MQNHDTDIIEKLKNASTLIASAASVLENALDEMKASNITEAVTTYFLVKQQYDELDLNRKKLYAAVDAMNKFKIPTLLEEIGQDKIRVPALARSFYITKKYSCSMLDKEKGMKWLKDRGDGALIQPTVNSGTLASYMKSLVADEGIDPPDDIFKFSSYNTTGMSKYTPKPEIGA